MNSRHLHILVWKKLDPIFFITQIFHEDGAHHKDFFCHEIFAYIKNQNFVFNLFLSWSNFTAITSMETYMHKQHIQILKMSNF